MNKNNKLISYMEGRYGKTFTYLGETNGIFGTKAFTARLSCPDYPDEEILVSWLERDGEEYYSDNYLAVYYHEEAFQRMDQAAGKVFSDYQLYFAVPDVLMTVDKPETYSLEDYLADPLAYKTVYILTEEVLDEAVFQALMKCLAAEGVTVKGVVAVPSDTAGLPDLAQESVDAFLADSQRIETQVNFKLENGTLVSENWR